MRISVFSITSLLISVAAFVLYAVLLDGTNVYVPWIILSVLAMFFPLLSKYFRKRKAKKGKGLEIAALVIGAFDFYFVFFAATKINLFFIFILIAVICVLYAKLFNNIVITNKDNFDNICTKTTVCPDMTLCKPDEKADVGTITSANLTTTENISIQKNKREAKRKFCSQCGSQIDPLTKKCTGCGKQYFKGIKLNKNTIIIAMLSILLIASITINIVQNNEIGYLYDDYFETQNYIRELEGENSKQLGWINLYETKVVVVIDGSKIYHKGSCEKIKGETGNLAWKSGIENMGYTACPYCHK